VGKDETKSSNLRRWRSTGKNIQEWIMDIQIDSKKYGIIIFKIDEEDFQKIKKYKWKAVYSPKTKSFYIASSVNDRNIYLHRFLLNNPDGFFVDHINRNTLDNRRCNLRVCDNSQNSMNKIKKKSKSNYKGVYQRNDTKKYEASICVRGKRIKLGCYENEDQAAIAYNMASIAHHGEFSNININIMMNKGLN
jgi:hypothetical protein